MCDGAQRGPFGPSANAFVLLADGVPVVFSAVFSPEGVNPMVQEARAINRGISTLRSVIARDWNTIEGEPTIQHLTMAMNVWIWFFVPSGHGHMLLRSANWASSAGERKLLRRS